MSSPHHKVREQWLALTQEDILAPGQPILDAHHHLWDRPEGRYRAEEFRADRSSGHDVRASVYVQCRTGYRATGPEALRPVLGALNEVGNGSVTGIRNTAAWTPDPTVRSNPKPLEITHAPGCTVRQTF